MHGCGGSEVRQSRGSRAGAAGGDGVEVEGGVMMLVGAVRGEVAVGLSGMEVRREMEKGQRVGRGLDW